MTERVSGSDIIGLVLSLSIASQILPQFIDKLYKVNMKEIHYKCSKHCKHKRAILRGEYDV